jgi:hypothetical protein
MFMVSSIQPFSPQIAIVASLCAPNHTLLDVGHVRTMTNDPADVARVITGAEPIRELMT